ncbi:MAG: acetolactate synthase small subunit [Bacteroides sp.]|nr:acetolactate synthase small subunit [Bacteroides sp.]
MEEQLFTITLYTENRVTLLHQISMIFSRRCLNIDSITASPCAIPGVHKYTITCHSTRSMLEHVVRQMEKRIDVIKAYIFTDDEILYQEVALYKVPTENVVNTDIEEIVRWHGARVLEIQKDYTVFEKTGQTAEIMELYEKLKPLGIRQFVRSGRVAVTRSSRELVDEFLIERDGRMNNQN